MTIQELATKYSNADAETLAFIETVLDWRDRVSAEQASEFFRKIISILDKHGEVCSWENEREELMHELSRLNVERSKMKKEKESLDDALQAKKQWFAELEQAKSGFDALTEKESALNKDETEIKQRYSETKKMIEELQQNRWLSSDVRESIKKVWGMLPVDELDKALTK
jgi:chromosome segregation ATPase